MTRAAEASRQRQFVRALLARDAAALAQAPLGGGAVRIERGLDAYAANADASAERALGASFPVLRALVGQAAFAALARAWRLSHPPARGDLFWLGEGFADFVAADASRASEPYLADCARLDWLLACAEVAEDASFDADSLALLADTEPERIALELRPGSAILDSPHPVMTIRLAHLDASEDERGFALAREALRAGRGECVFVWRTGWRAQTALLSPLEQRFMAALLDRRTSLGGALDATGSAFDFQAWLARALSAGWLHRAVPIAA